jgi:hypothetical protein
MNQEQIELANQIVSELVRQWDPYSLLASGCPNDEFDPEVSSIVSNISSIHTEQDATRIISEVFSSAFEPEHFTEDICKPYGRDLFAILDQKKLIS